MQTSQLQVIRRASFKAAPWKNGGGITHEAIRVPALGDPFRWRASVAQIDASGPFSDFAVYNRKMVLLQGAGLELRFADGVQRTLREPGDLVEFDGALAVHCELLGGPCVDLNLMVLKSQAAAARVERFSETFEVTAQRDETLLIFPINRPVTLTLDQGHCVALEPWDLAVLRSVSSDVCRLESSQNAGVAAVFVAALGTIG